MRRAAILIAVAFALAAPAAEAAPSAAALPWLAGTCGSLVALQHDAGLARVAPTPAASRTVAAAIEADLAALQRTAATVPAVPAGGAIAARLSDAVLTATRSIAGRGRQVTTFGAARAYASTVDGASRTLASAFLRLVSGNGSPSLDRAFEQVPACEVVHG